MARPAPSPSDSTPSGNQGIGRLTSETFTGGPNNTLSGSYAPVYDARGQETSRSLTVGSQGCPVQSSFELWRNSTNSPTGAFAISSYDSTASGNQGIGRLTSETFTGGPNNSLTGSYAHVYDARGQEASRTLTVGAQGYPVQSSFDDAGNLLTQTYPTGELVTTGYSAQGWVSGVSTSQGRTTLLANAAYSQGANQFGGPAGLMTGASLGGGTYQYSASYDALLRASDLKVTNGSGSTTFFEQARTFDGASNVTAANTTLPAGSDHQAFCYDEQNRLTWAGAAGTPPCGVSLTPGTLTTAQYAQSFAYDTLGRLTSGPVGSYTYGNAAHLHAATAIGTTWTAAYDVAGNMSCRAPTASVTCAGTPTGAALSFDPQGQLSAWQNAPSAPSSSDGFLYDNQGNRVEQQSAQAGTTTTTVYVGNLEQVANSGSTTTATTYYYANRQRIALAVNGVFSYLATDGLGSATVALNAGGSVTASLLYAPYGGSRYSNGTMPTDFGFTGQHADGTTGLDYYSARYYDPVAGQFASADGFLPAGGYDTLGLSRYAYVEGNPVARTDPSGNVAETGSEDGGCYPSCTMASVSSSSAVQARHQAPTNDSLLGRLSRGVAGFIYEPPLWAGVIPGLSVNSLVMHVSMAIPQDQQDAFVFATMGVAAPFEAEASLLRTETTVLRTEGALDASVAAGGLSPELRAAAEAHITDSGDTVLGTFLDHPNYVEKAQARKASYFDIGTDLWNDTAGPRANQHFLDTIGARGDRILLNIPKNQIQEGTTLAAEVEAMRINWGYKWVNQWSMRPGQ